MAKTWLTATQIEALRAKFDEATRRRITRKYQTRPEMVADGWTEEELLYIQYCAPRTKPANRTTMPQVDGYALCGTSMENEEEYRIYCEAKSGSSANSSESTPRASSKQALSAEAVSALTELFNEIKANGNERMMSLSTLLATTLANPNSPVMKLFGVPFGMMLESKVSLAWVMYRKSNGERFENKQGTLAQFITEDEDLECVLTKSQVHELVEGLKAKGEDYTQTIIGYLK